MTQNIQINIGTQQPNNLQNSQILQLKQELSEMEKERLDYYKNLALDFKQEINSLKTQNKKFRLENLKLKLLLKKSNV
jgi:hypothetical protein